MRIDFTNMVIEYEDYTGTPKFEDFVSMIWDKIVLTHDVWRWKYFSNRVTRVGSPLPKVAKPKNFDPHSIKFFFLVYDSLMEIRSIQEKKENQRFRKMILKKKSKQENVSQAIRDYIEAMTGEKYDPVKNGAQFNTLRQLTKAK